MTVYILYICASRGLEVTCKSNEEGVRGGRSTNPLIRSSACFAASVYVLSSNLIARSFSHPLRLISGLQDTRVVDAQTR